MDGEGMMETEAAHKAHFSTMESLLRPLYPHMLAIGAGLLYPLHLLHLSRCALPLPDSPL